MEYLEEEEKLIQAQVDSIHALVETGRFESAITLAINSGARGHMSLILALSTRFGGQSEEMKLLMFIHDERYEKRRDA